LCRTTPSFAGTSPEIFFLSLVTQEGNNDDILQHVELNALRHQYSRPLDTGLRLKRYTPSKLLITVAYLSKPCSFFLQRLLQAHPTCCVELLDSSGRRHNMKVKAAQPVFSGKASFWE